MKKIAPGLSLKKYNGNSHKNGGIIVNALGNKTKDINKAVAEVEGGEYNYRYNPNNPKDNYILSKELGIANMAKQADRFKDNDRISYNTRNNLLNKSMKLNEMLRVQQEQQPMQMAALGGKLKKYKNGGGFLLKGSQSIVDSMVANSKPNDTTKIATAPEIKLGTTTAPKLETNPIALPTLPKTTTTPKTTAEAANLGVKVNTNNNATPEPTINKKGVKDITSGLSDVASAFGPIGQGIGAAIQLAPYAIDLGKAMFDKTSVQDLQTQGSAMRLPNTTYAKNGGKLNITLLPKFQTGGDTLNVKDVNPFDKITKKEGTVSSGRVNMNTPFDRRRELVVIPSNKITGTVSSGRVDMENPFNRNNANKTNKNASNKVTGEVSSGRIQGNPFDTRFNPTTTTGVMTNTTGKLETDPFNTGNPLFNKLPIPPIVDINNPFNRNRDLVDPFNLNKDKKKSTEVIEDTPVTTTDNKSNTGKNKSNTGGSKGSTGGKSTTNTTPTTTSTNMLPSKGLMLPSASNIVKAAKDRFDKDNLEKEYDTKLSEALKKFYPNKGLTPGGINPTEKTEELKTPESESSRLYKAGQNKQKLSEALMYGMAALPSEQIKTITPDYGRGDDAMSRMGLSTEPIRQEMMQGANKALELTRSQVGTAGQLQSRGQSIMSNVGSQLAQSQIQQQQYLNQLRSALAQREDTKANVLAQSELTAREAKSAERAAKLDQLNNAISQTSAIGAGTMEQASKMSTIENENERFKRNQDFIRSLANQGISFKVDENGNIVFDNRTSSSTIPTPNLAKPDTNISPESNVSPTPATTTEDTYTIKKGDTLYAIAKANNTTVSNLIKANNYKDDKALILPGQTIKLK
jgi:LysM repeat protein